MGSTVFVDLFSLLLIQDELAAVKAAGSVTCAVSNKARQLGEMCV